ncbi:MAG TPA: carboxypeptidase regulatory-like domain-containing protein, partial [Pyrinomonadaceae bacterium]|nr:carboxypeptidase regulatory-like domain-containing protein [Pyrinomonadaceae bacterium]
MLSKRFVPFVPFLLLVAVFLATSTALAQSTATLQGTVADSKGAVLPSATIVVRNRSTSAERTTQTDSDGNYQLAALPPGVYSVEVRVQGFKTQVADSVTLEVAKTAIQNFQMDVGAISEQVLVSSDVPVIETTTVSVGTVINQRTVQEIPLNGRHFVDLGLLIPGSVTPPQNGFLTAPLRGQGSFAFNTAGGREDTVNFMINGVNLNDMVQNQITFQPSINTVQEFKVDNSTFSAEYGRNSGAVVNIATRSGSNDYHGELFEFLRNDVLDARNFFDAKKPPFRRNQFGFNIGGPLHLPRFGEGGSGIGYNGKNRTFFFFSYEGLRQRQGLTLTSNVLTDAQRASVTNAAVLKLLPLIPRATSVDIVGGVPVARFSGSGTAPVNIDQWTGDVSHNISNNDRIHGYYAFQKDKRGEPNLQGNTLPGFGDTRQSHRQIFTLNETHIFGPSLTNEARLGFNRINITFTPNFQVRPLDFNIDTGVDLPIGLPQISITGFNFNIGGPAGFPQGRADTTVVVSDTLTYLRGNHSFKFGGEGRRFYNNNFNLDTGNFTVPNVTSFINGIGNQFTITKGDRSSAIIQNALGFYVQDNYKARSNLTLELGLRYDWNMTPTERYDRFVVFDPATRTLVRVGSGLDKVYGENNKNLQPRVGIAWDPFKDGKTSVRAAYAVLTDQPVTNVVTPLTSNPPLADPRIVTGAVSLINPGGGGAAALAPNSVDTGFDNAYVQSWNLNIQREVGKDLGVTIGYFGTKGTHLRVSRNINQPINGGARPFPSLSSSDPFRPNATLNNIVQIEGTGNSSYNALWLTATKRLSRGFQFNTSYTFSKSIDYNSLNSQGVVVQDSYNLRGSRGLSDFDARHRFVFSGIYEVPFHGNQLKEGWQLGAIVQSQSGNPVNIVVNNAAFTGTNNTVRPDVTGPIDILGTPNRWFDISPFVVPVGRFGSLGRNVVIGPGFNNTDFSVIKRTKLTETQLIEFRWEVFDLFNHANFGQPGRVVGSTNFGQITNTRFATGDSGSSRQMQF